VTTTNIESVVPVRKQARWLRIMNEWIMKKDRLSLLFWWKHERLAIFAPTFSEPDLDENNISLR
jgi:hypothetical protein